MSTKEAQDQLKREGEGALSTSEYWDLRYAQADGENATHEWFRSFSALLPFLQSNLFDARPIDQKPKILHFGSGDSVSGQNDCVCSLSGTDGVVSRQFLTISRRGDIKTSSVSISRIKS
jgi:hypothetical protein